MKRTLLSLLTIAVAVALGFSQGKVTRQKTTKTEQSQQSSDKPKPKKEKKQKREVAAKNHRDSSDKKRQQAEVKHKQEEERKQEEEKRRQEEEAQRKQTEEAKRLQEAEEQRKKEEEEALRKYRGFINGHEWVDLGLPSGIKWATCNLGSNYPEECGDYYAWGETMSKSEYNTRNSITDNKGTHRLNTMAAIVKSTGNLAMAFDAATHIWGGSWRMPTKEEFEELINECEWRWTEINSKDGYVVTGPNKASVFFPVAGYRDGSALECQDGGYYWTSTPGNERDAYALYFHFNRRELCNYGRYFGSNIRPVSD